METIIAAVIAAASAVTIAIIEKRAADDRKKAEEDRNRVEERAKIRERESRLSMEMMNATCALSLVAAKKLTGQHTNGDVEEAMTKARAAQAKYDDFIKDTVAHQVSV